MLAFILAVVTACVWTAVFSIPTPRTSQRKALDAALESIGRAAK